MDPLVEGADFCQGLTFIHVCNYSRKIYEVGESSGHFCGNFMEHQCSNTSGLYLAFMLECV